MSATLAPFGLRPAFHPSGVIRTTRRDILPAYTTAIFKGDPIKVVAGGGINLSGATGAVDGAFAGCEYIDPTGKPNVSNYWPGTASCTEIKGYVYDDPNIVYEIQAAGTLAAEDVGEQIGLTSASIGAGSTQTGLSVASLDISTVATTADQFSIWGLAPYEGNAWGDAYPIVQVVLATSAFRAGGTGI